MPASSDDEYQYSSDDQPGAHNVGTRQPQTGSSSRNRPQAQGGRSQVIAGGGRSGGGQGGGRGANGGSSSGQGLGRGVKRAGGFEVSRTWEALEEGEDGTMTATVEGLREMGLRKRLMKDTTPFQRGIIRHLIVALDLSESMSEKDLRPTRYLRTILNMTAFVREFFEQNPISQLGIIGMRDGVAVRVSDISGNPEQHIAALTKLKDADPKGHPSLQNALEMSRGALFNAPSHGTREVLLIFGAIYTVDPTDIHETIHSLVNSRIRCSVIGLSASVDICKALVKATNPSVPLTQSYTVALDELHFRDLLMVACTPPPLAATDTSITAGASAGGATTGGSGGAGDGNDTTGGALIRMGFPSLTTSSAASLCACHGMPSRTGYSCPVCAAKTCALPSTCRVCGLTLVQSTHLARSYHHLFPLQTWREVGWGEVMDEDKKHKEGLGLQRNCKGCLSAFTVVPEKVKERIEKEEKEREKEGPALGQGQKEGQAVGGAAGAAGGGNGYSESGRYKCEACGFHFCADCDYFCHATLHNCPGCTSGPQPGEPVVEEGGVGPKKEEKVMTEEEAAEMLRLLTASL